MKLNETQQLLLDILKYRIFAGEKPEIKNRNIKAVADEAMAQTVFTAVFPVIEKAMLEKSPEDHEKYYEIYLSNMILNSSNLHDHGELHRIMSENSIPYTVIKGFSSAYYYPDPALRDMGDVDFLVKDEDFNKAGSALISNGFKREHESEDDDIHEAYTKNKYSIWELHRRINGIPGGETGKAVTARLNEMIGNSKLIKLEKEEFRIPDEFSHGLIMLLHTASHLTSEGVGLRHLCDWAVFVSRYSDSDFSDMFSFELKRLGLYKFAQVLTLTAERHLGAPKKEWAQNMRFDESITDELILDILSGGNFGKKDINRYREIKYIQNRGERTVDNKNLFAQLFSTLNKKVYSEHRFINRHRFLLPAGWVAEGAKYTGLLITGKRKNRGTADMLKEASKRKEIYSSFELFKNNDAAQN